MNRSKQMRWLGPLLMAAHVAATASPWQPLRDVSQVEVTAMMRKQQAQGYALTAIANAVRLQVGVFLGLAAAARESDPERRPLRVRHEAYFAAYLEVTGLTAANVPVFASAPHRFGEDFLIDYRTDDIVDPTSKPPALKQALDIKAGWPDVPGSPPSYSYEDRSTDPAVEVTHERVNSYRILDFGHAVVYDDIRGVTGRATSGLLGAIFSVIGKAQAARTRFAIAPDGTQVSQTTARKLISVTQTVTISPDGTVFTGIPEQRPDLEAIDRMLTRLPVTVRYREVDAGAMPGR